MMSSLSQFLVLVLQINSGHPSLAAAHTVASWQRGNDRGIRAASAGGGVNALPAPELCANRSGQPVPEAPPEEGGFCEDCLRFGRAPPTTRQGWRRRRGRGCT